MSAAFTLGCGARSSLLEGGPAPGGSDSGGSGGASCVAPAKTWSQQIGGPRAQIATDLAVDQLGYPIIVGAFRGELPVNGTVLTSPAPVSDLDMFSDDFALSGDFFLARLAPEGCGAMAKH